MATHFPSNAMQTFQSNSNQSNPMYTYALSPKNAMLNSRNPNFHNNKTPSQIHC